MSSTPISERLVCPTCFAKLTSTKTVNLPKSTMVSCSSCKTRFSLAQGRVQEQRTDSGDPADLESKNTDLSSRLDSLPPPLDFPNSEKESFGEPPFGHFESETAFSTRTKGLAKEVIEAVRPKIGEIPSDIAEVVDTNAIVYASHPSGTAKFLLRFMMLLATIPFLLLILFQIYYLLFVSSSLELMLGILLSTIGVAIPFVLLHLSWKNTFYVITRDKIVIRSGIFNRAIKIAWVKNVQEISINSGVIDRWLNLNTIHFSTASSGIGGLLFAWIPGSTIGGIRFRHVELKKVLRALKTLEL